MSKTYIYDGTFEGLLCCIYAAYYIEMPTAIINSVEINEEADGYQYNMASTPEILKNHQEIHIRTEAGKADRVYEAINKKISPYDLRQIYRAYISKLENKEMKILTYVKKGFKLGPNVSRLHGDKDVYEIQRAAKQVGCEIDRMYGFVRFQELRGGIMFARIDPDNDILAMLSRHFVSRFGNYPFIIYDEKRKKALFCRDKKWYITDFDEEKLPLPLSPDEKKYQDLWAEYFKNIAIKERTNEKCQLNHMPRRYWKNLTEICTDVASHT